MSGEILRPYPVSCNEFCVGKLATQCFNQFDEMSRDRLDNGAHPQGNRSTLPRVQAKCFIINILRHDVTQLQSQWPSGLGDASANEFLCAPTGARYASIPHIFFIERENSG